MRLTPRGEASGSKADQSSRQQEILVGLQRREQALGSAGELDHGCRGPRQSDPALLDSRKKDIRLIVVVIISVCPRAQGVSLVDRCIVPDVLRKVPVDLAQQDLPDL